MFKVCDGLTFKKLKKSYLHCFTNLSLVYFFTVDYYSFYSWYCNSTKAYFYIVLICCIFYCKITAQYKNDLLLLLILIADNAHLLMLMLITLWNELTMSRKELQSHTKFKKKYNQTPSEFKFLFWFVFAYFQQPPTVQPGLKQDP